MNDRLRKKKGIQKGQYGYIKKRRKTVLLLTSFMFMLSLAVYLTGYWSTGTNQNLLTIVAVLGCLPACKSLVNFIMYAKAKGCSPEAYEKISQIASALPSLYDMFFTSYEKNYQVSHIIISHHLICGLTENKNMDSHACEQHVETLLKQGCCKQVTVKIYQDLEGYCDALLNLASKQETEEAIKIQAGLLSISL